MNLPFAYSARNLLARRKRVLITSGLTALTVLAVALVLGLIAGIKTDVEGMENIPEGPCIIASKHMSDWDIFALLPGARRPAFIAKKELMDIPFFGQAAMAFDTIRVDRSKGSDAIPLMLSDARRSLANGADRSRCRNSSSPRR